MNKNYKLLIGIGALAVLYFVFKKKGTTAKSTKTNESASSNEIGKELSKFQIDQLKKVAVKEGDSPKVIAIKTFQADLFINPPKSEAEAKARTAKYGITVADVDEYLGNPKSEFASFEDGKTRIKPSSVSGLSVSKRPRNYGTAQRPTRALMGKKRTSDGMDFDGNDDVQGSMM